MSGPKGDTPHVSAPVMLVGAGPGDPDLLTVLGARVLRQADAVVYDSLVHPLILQRYAPHAEQIYVGKRAGGIDATPQDEINRILVEHAKKGERVVRLKGGDPFLYGRGAEECAYLRANGIEYEVIPGVPAMIAVSAYLGVPLTHRDLSSSVIVLTGSHAGAAKAEESVWQAAAKTQTVVVYMGMLQLEEISQRLMTMGRSADEPVAVVTWGTTGRQQAVHATLAEISDQVKAAALHPPGLIIIGRVVAEADKLHWWDAKPLFGLRVALLRPSETVDELATELIRNGADVIVRPMLRSEPLHNTSERIGLIARAVGHGRPPQWIVLTSRIAAQLFREAFIGSGLDIRQLAGAMICTAGQGTADELSQMGLRADFVSERGAQQIGQHICAYAQPETRVLWPCGVERRDAWVAEVERAGITVEPLTLYRTTEAPAPPPIIDRRLRDRDFDVLVLSSPKIVRSFVREFGAGDMGKATVVVTGDATAQEVREQLGVDAVEVMDPSTASIYSAIHSIHTTRQNKSGGKA